MLYGVIDLLCRIKSCVAGGYGPYAAMSVLSDNYWLEVVIVPEIVQTGVNSHLQEF